MQETNSKWLIIIPIVLLVGMVVWLGSNIDIPAQNIAPVQALEAFYPEATNYAVDAANALTPGELATMNNLLKTMDTDKHQFAVVIVKTTSPLSIEEYGIKLAEKWKVGYKGIDNGAIVILATDDRKVRIEVGYGLEGQINDAKAGRIIDDFMIPALKNAQWGTAITAALVELNNQTK